ncbi:MAG: hypothetical protein ACXQTE_05585 [Methanosarcinaceae archaeon]
MDDIHSFDIGFTQAMKRLRNVDIGQRNRDLLEQIVIACKHVGLTKSTIIGYIICYTDVATVR